MQIETGQIKGLLAPLAKLLAGIGLALALALGLGQVLASGAGRAGNAMGSDRAPGALDLQEAALSDVLDMRLAQAPAPEPTAEAETEGGFVEDAPAPEPTAEAESGGESGGEGDALPPTPAITTGAEGRGPVTNLPLPRYVSLKTGEGNARRGPSLSHRIDWVFRHRDMPLRVTAEFGNWRRVEDRDGAGGWVHYALLSGVRTVMITGDDVRLLARPDETSGVVALAESGAVARLLQCSTNWCRLAAGGERGWAPKSQLWGVDPGEIVE